MDFILNREPKSVEPGYEKNTIESPVEDGYVISRPRYTRVRRTYTVKWDGVNSDYANIDNFYRITTSGGSLPFFITLNFAKTDNLEANAQISTNVQVRFTEPPKITYQGMGVWEIRCSFMEV